MEFNVYNEGMRQLENINVLGDEDKDMMLLDEIYKITNLDSCLKTIDKYLSQSTHNVKAGAENGTVEILSRVIIQHFLKIQPR